MLIVVILILCFTISYVCLMDNVDLCRQSSLDMFQVNVDQYVVYIYRSDKADP